MPARAVDQQVGIAVGMATNIPPHNLNEVVDGCLHLLRNPEASIDELMEIIPAPDFPTAGIIYGINGVKDGYLITKRADGWHLINFHGDSVAGAFATESQATAVAEVFVDEAGHASSKRPKGKGSHKTFEYRLLGT
eukprot:gene51914-63477_t